MYLKEGNTFIFDDPSKSQINEAYRLFHQSGYGQSSIEYLYKRFFFNPYIIFIIVLIILICIIGVSVLFIQLKKQRDENVRLFDAIKNNESYNSEIINEVSLIRHEYRNKIISITQSESKQKEEYENVAHQMKSSISTILLNTELLETQDMIHKNRILEQLERSNKLLNYFLSAHTITSNQNIFEFKVSNLKTCIESGLQDIESYAKKREISINTQLEDCFMSFDSFWMQEVFETILMNSMDHSKIQTEVNIELKNHIDNVCIQIQNTGSKIDSSIDIFERYATNNKDDGHFGIGLHMAKNIIEHHFGKIEVKSNHDVVTFLIQFPLHKLEQIEF